MIEVKIVERIPSVEKFISLRTSVGWKSPETVAAEKGLKNSLFMVCAELDGEIVGCGRIIGDGGFVYYIQDIIVLPKHQAQGIGAKIMDSILEYLNKQCVERAIIGLMAAKGKESFYKKYGFIERPNNNLGAGMIKPF